VFERNYDETLRKRFNAAEEDLPLRAVALPILRGRNVALARTGDIVPTDVFQGLGDDVMHSFGLIDLPENPDAVVRSVLVYQEENGQFFPSLPAVVALRAQKKVPTDGAALRALAGPADAQPRPGMVRVNYLGPPDQVFPMIPAEAVEAGALTPAQQAQLKDALVLIGPHSPSLSDTHRGPGRFDYYGIEIHAHTLANLLDGRPLRRFSPAGEALQAGLVALVVGIGTLFLSVWGGLALGTVLAVGWLLGTMQLLSGDRLLPVAGPLTGLALGWVTQVGLQALDERRRRSELQRTFGPFVGPEVMAHLLTHPEEAGLGGRRQILTVLFSDIKGFTDLSNTLPPEIISRMLNQYFAEMTRIVFQHGGTVDKFIGDGLMAFWNAPTERREHAADAVRAALEMTQALEQLNAGWYGDQSLERSQVIEIRIGINTGPAVVGNLGSADRLSYTAIGQTVNIAARLEAQNKELNSVILLARETYEQAVLRLNLDGVRREAVDLKGVAEAQAVFLLQAVDGVPVPRMTAVGSATRGLATTPDPDRTRDLGGRGN